MPSIYQSLGLLNLVSGDRAQAVANYSKAAALAPNDVFNVLMLGQLLNADYQDQAKRFQGLPNGAAKDEELKKTQVLLDKVIDAYARAVAVSEGDTRNVLSQGDEWYSFAVLDQSSGRFLGGVGINFINRVHQFANLGYWVRTSAAGRGVATRATRLAARFGFQALGLNRIEIVAAVDNIASQRVAERAGAVREGILRHRLSINGVPHDAVLFSLVAGDLNAS